MLDMLALHGLMVEQWRVTSVIRAPSFELMKELTQTLSI
jgi:hypothetical protein